MLEKARRNSLFIRNLRMEDYEPGPQRDRCEQAAKKSCASVRIRIRMFHQLKHLLRQRANLRKCLSGGTMKKFLLLVPALFICALLLPGPAASADDNPEKILNQAWTAYNIGKYKETIRLVQPLANEGNPRAQVILGKCYENGLGVEQDMAVAAQWFQLAAEQNYSEAQVLLAYCYEIGAGVPKNPQQVMNLMTRAAESGNPEAQFNLAINYSQGLYGAPKNEQASFLWAERSASQGYAQAERFLGACYEYGFGTNANPALAQEWYAKAQAQGLSRDGSVFGFVRDYSMTGQE